MNSKDLQRPSGLAFDPRKGEVYVTCPGNGQIVVFDRHYNIVRRIQDPQMLAPQGIVFIESLQEIYVTGEFQNFVKLKTLETKTSLTYKYSRLLIR